VGLERGPLILVSTIEELLERKSSGFGLENRDYGRRDPPPCHVTPLYPQKLEQTSPTSGSLSVGISHSWTKATELSLLSSSYRILSNILLSRLSQHIDEIAGDHQCGFRCNISSTDQSFCIRHTGEKMGVQ
jgi:hypothetical protein